MKKKIYIVLGIILVSIIIVGIITNYVDSGRISTGHEPKYCIKITSDNGSRVTYWGLGYKVIRHVGVSPNEPYESNIGVKMGNWSMKYELPEYESINIELLQKGHTIEITDRKDIELITNILVNSKYISEVCQGIDTHKIILGNEVYFIKEHCLGIVKEDKEAEITREDLDKILKIIDNKVTKYVTSDNNVRNEKTINKVQEIENLLGGYIATDLYFAKEKPLNDIIKADMNNVEYSKVMITDQKVGIYAIVKTADNKIIKNLDNYFSKEYAGYKKVVTDDKYYIYLYNRLNDINLEEELNRI